MLQKQVTEKEELQKDALLYHLARLGVPLARHFDQTYPSMSKRTVFEGALDLVHHDPVLARCFPLLVEQNRDFLADKEEFAYLALDSKRAKTLGFFMDLTGELANAPELSEQAQALFSKLTKETELEPFFAKKLSKRRRLVAEQTTPQVAKKWGFLLNIGLDSFASHFRKFSHLKCPSL